MTIRSSFEDFYDYAAYYLGEDAFYKREINNRELCTKDTNGNKQSPYYKDTVVLDLDHKVYSEHTPISHRSIENDTDNVLSFVIIGELIIPFYTKVSKVTPEYNSYKVVFNYEVATNLTKAEQLKLKDNYNDLYTKIRQHTDEPLVLLSPFTSPEDVHSRHKMRGPTINPQLKQLKGITSLVTAEQVIQELSMYLTKEPNIVHITDDLIKRDSAGFDNYSFKHKKEQHEFK